MTVLSHLVTGECWGIEGKAEGGDEDVVRERVADKVWSDQVPHQSGSSEEDEDTKKEYEGKLEKKVMEGNAKVEANIAHCRIHAKVNTWVIHHP